MKGRFWHACYANSSGRTYFWDTDLKKYGWVRYHHCACYGCTKNREYEGAVRCEGNCDGCRRRKEDRPLPWSIRIARGIL